MLSVLCRVEVLRKTPAVSLKKLANFTYMPESFVFPPALRGTIGNGSSGPFTLAAPQPRQDLFRAELSSALNNVGFNMRIKGSPWPL